MTPERLEEIRECVEKLREGFNKQLDAQLRTQAERDTLERVNTGLRSVAGRALRDRAWLTGCAARLLAHQQARGLAERYAHELERGAHERTWASKARAFAALSLERTKNTTLRAENQRLRAALQAVHEAFLDNGLSESWTVAADLAEAALSEKGGGDA